MAVRAAGREDGAKLEEEPSGWTCFVAVDMEVEVGFVLDLYSGSNGLTYVNRIGPSWPSRFGKGNFMGS
jgi:hypothetical protein